MDVLFSESHYLGSVLRPRFLETPRSGPLQIQAAARRFFTNVSLHMAYAVQQTCTHDFLAFVHSCMSSQRAGCTLAIQKPVPLTCRFPKRQTSHNAQGSCLPANVLGRTIMQATRWTQIARMRLDRHMNASASSRRLSRGRLAHSTCAWGTPCHNSSWNGEQY